MGVQAFIILAKGFYVMSLLSSIFGSAMPPPPVAPQPPAPPAPPVPPTDSALAASEKLIALREGRRLTVYKDSRGFLTVGDGHLVVPADKLKLGDTISNARADSLLAADLGGSLAAAHLQAEQAGITSPAFLPYLTSVCFQMGLKWTTKFPNTWAMVCRGEYERAALALNGTPWQAQTPVRVTDFQTALRALPPKA